MPDATRRRRRKISVLESAEPSAWTTSLLFPEPRRLPERGPLPKQKKVLELIKSGKARGGGIVYQGGYGAAKTISLCVADIWCHLAPHIPGLQDEIYWSAGFQSVILRETYGRLQASTWQEYKLILSRVPKRFIEKVNAPTKSSMGVLEWEDGGITLFVSLSEIDALASANIGFVGVDEGHLQDPIAVEKADDRNRHPAGPRVMLITKNPAGHDYSYQWANPRSEEKKPRWHYIESSIYDNPELPDDYKERLEAKYPKGTLAHRRWCLGESCPLEGSAFGEIFYPDTDFTMHLLPGDFEIPEKALRGRGLDWGLRHLTACVWGAYDESDRTWYIYRAYDGKLRGAEFHAQKIAELEAGEDIHYTPSAHDLWKKQAREGEPLALYSLSEAFLASGCSLSQANTDRITGLNQLWELLTPHEFEYDEDGRKIEGAVRLHPITGKPGRPRIFFLDNPSVWRCIRWLEKVMWPGDAAQLMVRDRPDDVVKKNDDYYDALRYLIMEEADDAAGKKPVRAVAAEPRGTRGYVGYSRPHGRVEDQDGERVVAQWSRDPTENRRARPWLTSLAARARRDGR